MPVWAAAGSGSQDEADAGTQQKRGLPHFARPPILV
jgi:hypothetical protein